MLNRIIDLTLQYRWLAFLGIVALLAGGGYALYTIPVEAFPDLTNNQVVVVTDAPSLPPTEVEQLVTYPIERADARSSQQAGGSIAFEARAFHGDHRLR